MHKTPEFSHQTRLQNLKRLETETFDFLVIGGGITGAGVAWDASSRGYKVALIEKEDFAHGTSSRSSKLVHGGLRYLENYEFSLVFESLSERAYLMETCAHLVKPLPFYMPVYEKGPHSSYLLSAGMWLYDLLSLFRAPGLHQRLSAGATLRTIPGIQQEGLICSFKYFDASMWDDALVIDVLSKAQSLGACIASRTKAVSSSLNERGEITSILARDELSGKAVPVRFKKLIVCAGVWTDEVGRILAPGGTEKPWKNWLAPSRGLHLVFDWKSLPVPGAVTMQIADGRIAFVIPRHDYGQGITIVGTTDGPCSLPPDRVDDEVAAIAEDRAYLIDLLAQYFPHLHLTDRDVLNHYIGIRPLVNPHRNDQGDGKENLQKVSREHTIDHGPGGSVVVAGGKYTTFRRMAEEIVNFALTQTESPSLSYQESNTDEVLFIPALLPEITRAREVARAKGYLIPEKLFERYGADALQVYEIHLKHCDLQTVDPEGFPCLEAQFRYAVRHQMVLTVEDFVKRRQPLYLCRQDHGRPWWSILQKALEQELLS